MDEEDEDGGETPPFDTDSAPPFCGKKANTVLLGEAVSHLVKRLKYKQRILKYAIGQKLHLPGEFFHLCAFLGNSAAIQLSSCHCLCCYQAA